MKIFGTGARQFEPIRKELIDLGIDAAACWCGYTPNDMQKAAAFAEWFGQGKPLITFETPCIGRKQFDGGPQSSVYYRISVGSASSNTGFTNFEINPRRTADVLLNLGLSIQPLRDEKEDDILIYAMQIPWDTSLRGADIYIAAEFDIALMRQRHPKLPIVVTTSPHSGHYDKERLDKLQKAMNLFGAVFSFGGTSKLLPKCRKLYCRTSSTVYDALLAGVPATVLDHASYAFGKARIEAIDYAISRQYTVAEIKEDDFALIRNLAQDYTKSVRRQL